MRLSSAGLIDLHVDGGSPESHAPTSHVWAIFAAVRDPSPQRPSRKTVILIPVPQTLTEGAAGLFTKWSASSMQVLRLPWPAPSPRTAEPSMYAFWLMSSFAFPLKAAAPQRTDTKMTVAKFMLPPHRK